MAEETDLSIFVTGMTPKLNVGEYVFSTVKDVSKIDRRITICEYGPGQGCA